MSTPISRGLGRAPLLALAAVHWLGIVVAATGRDALAGAGWALGVAGALLAAGALVAAWRTARFGDAASGVSTGASPLAAGTAFVLVAAFLAGALASPPPASTSPLATAAAALGPGRLERPVRLEGVLADEPAHDGNQTVLRLAVDRLAANREAWAAPGLARVGVDGDRSGLTTLARGSRVGVWARVSLPSPPSNPGERAFRGPLALFGSTKSGLLVEELGPAPRFWRAIRDLRARVRARLRAADLEPDVRGVLAAVLMGDRTLVTSEVERAFRDAGTLHVMAVSGLHVGIVGSLIYWPLVFLGMRRRTALAVLLVALPLYAALCGGRPSVVRAVLMAAFVVFALRRGLFGEALNGLGLAAILLLAWSPWNALDVGFQLSFAATLAIVAAVRPRDPAQTPWDRAPGWRRWTESAVTVTLAAQLATFPVVAWHFGRVVIGGVLVAVPATLLATPVLGFGLAWLALGWVPGLDTVQLLPLEAVTRALIGVSAWGAGLPLGAVPVDPPGLGWLALWIGVGVLALAWRGQRRLLAAVPLVLLAVVALPQAPAPDGTLRLTTLDVGMGDALVLELPAGGAVLVDAGTAFAGWSAGEEVVTPFLVHLGHTRLRAVAPTHGDLDHVGGVHGVLRDIEAGELWESAALAQDDRPAVRRAREAFERPRRLSEGERFAFGGARFEVLLAGETIVEPEHAGNERSLVLMVEYAGRRLLLTGDAGAEAEEVLLARYPGRLRADVLKVGHHGSRTATTPEFLEAVDPEVAIVSTREDPRRRLPDAGVMERLAGSGARLLRTDHHGAITVEIDAEGRLTVRPFLPEERPR